MSIFIHDKIYYEYIYYEYMYLGPIQPVDRPPFSLKIPPFIP